MKFGVLMSAQAAGESRHLLGFTGSLNFFIALVRPDMFCEEQSGSWMIRRAKLLMR